MTTIVLKINERTKAGKAFKSFLEAFAKDSKALELVEPKKATALIEDKPYNPKFVSMVKKAQKRGKYTTVNTNDIWGSLGLK